MGVGARLGRAVRGAPALHAGGRDLHHLAHALGGAGVEEGDGGEGVKGFEGAASPLSDNTHGVDHGVDALEGGGPRSGLGLQHEVEGEPLLRRLGRAGPTRHAHHDVPRARQPAADG